MFPLEVIFPVTSIPSLKSISAPPTPSPDWNVCAKIVPLALIFPLAVMFASWAPAPIDIVEVFEPLKVLKSFITPLIVDPELTVKSISLPVCLLIKLAIMLLPFPQFQLFHLLLLANCHHHTLKLHFFFEDLML